METLRLQHSQRQLLDLSTATELHQMSGLDIGEIKLTNLVVLMQSMGHQILFDV